MAQPWVLEVSKGTFVHPVLNYSDTRVIYGFSSVFGLLWFHACVGGPFCGRNWWILLVPNFYELSVCLCFTASKDSPMICVWLGFSWLFYCGMTSYLLVYLLLQEHNALLPCAWRLQTITPKAWYRPTPSLTRTICFWIHRLLLNIWFKALSLEFRYDILIRIHIFYYFMTNVGL